MFQFHFGSLHFQRNQKSMWRRRFFLFHCLLLGRWSFYQRQSLYLRFR